MSVEVKTFQSRDGIFTHVTWQVTGGTARERTAKLAELECLLEEDGISRSFLAPIAPPRVEGDNIEFTFERHVKNVVGLPEGDLYNLTRDGDYDIRFRASLELEEQRRRQGAAYLFGIGTPNSLL